MDRVKKYIESVISGERNACQKEIWSVQRFIDDLERPEFDYRPDRVQAVLDFLDDLTLYKGPDAGKRMIVEPYFAFMIANLWGFWKKSDGSRRFRFSFQEVARKNVKSMTMAGLALLCVRFDYDAGAEVYNIATNHKQANDSYIKAFGLADKTRYRDDGSVERASLIDRRYFEKPISHKPQALTALDKDGKAVGVYQPLAHTPKRHDGLDPSLTIVEEYHAHPTADFVEVMKTGMGARPDSILAIITTAGEDVDGPCYAEYEYCGDLLDPSKPDVVNDTYFVQIFEMDEGDDWEDEKNWEKPNPCLGSVKLLDNMRAEFLPAKRNAKKRAEFRRKHLNVWGEQEDAHYSEETVMANFGEPIDLELLRGKVCATSADSGQTRDLSCLGHMFRNPLGDGRDVYLLRSFVPKGATSKEKNNADQYINWEEGEFLKITPGKMSSSSDLLEQLLHDRDELGFVIDHVQYDPRFLQDWAEDVEDEGFDIVTFSQGYPRFTAPCIRVEEKMEQTAPDDIEEVVGSYNCLGNPVWRWMARNYREKYKGDLRMPAKPDNPMSLRKIDGMVTMIMCEDGLHDVPAAPPKVHDPNV